MGIKAATQYFKVVSTREQYLGKRFFRYNYQSEICTQIGVSFGDIKKGKSNNFGIYLISKLTFFGNYLGPGYLQVITKKEWDKQFEDILTALR